MQGFRDSGRSFKALDFQLLWMEETLRHLIYSTCRGMYFGDPGCGAGFLHPSLGKVEGLRLGSRGYVGCRSQC